MMKSRPPSRSAGPPPPAGCILGTSRPGTSPRAVQARLATHFRLTVAICLCILAAGALFVPGFVFGAEGPTAAPAEDPSAVAPASELEQPTDESLAPAATTGTQLVTLPWGTGDGQVGLRRPAEGLTQGPEALAIAPDGRIAVLDSVNRRVVFLDAAGQVAGSAMVSLTEPRFLAVDDDRLYVLDCDADRRFVKLDWSGRDLGSLALPGLPDVVTGLFATAEGPCVEVAHQTSFLVPDMPQAKTAGNPAKPAQASLRALDGRPVDRDLGRVAKVTFKPGQNPRVKSFKIDRVSLKPTKTSDVSPSIAAGRAIEHLVSVDGDGKGGLIVGARLLEPEVHDGAQAYLVLTRLASTSAGTPGGAGTWAATGAGDTIFLAESSFAYLGQPYVVAPDGRIFQPVASDAGYSIFVHAFAGDETAVADEEVQP